MTTVPNGRLGLAQVPAGAPYQEAIPAVVLWGGSGAGASTGFGAVTGFGAAATATGAGAGAEGGGRVVGVVVLAVVGTGWNDTFST
ncbi:MAG TPA: hypothetical protein VK215_05475 [Acidimicrobiales bacterium]|nr:hypothetical protein [Acidimicrobiales bacterium]